MNKFIRNKTAEIEVIEKTQILNVAIKVFKSIECLHFFFDKKNYFSSPIIDIVIISFYCSYTIAGYVLKQTAQNKTEIRN